MSVSRIRIGAALAAVALFAAGCGDDSASAPAAEHAEHSAATGASSPAARTDFNDADVTFLTMMYPHHAQAVEMARLAPERASDPRLRALAADVERAQAPEMERISALLREFGRPQPSADGGHPMPGMMTGDQLSALRAATGAAFDRQWLELMIEHHLGAVDMAREEVANGVNAESLALARAVIDAQEAEIATMRAMLG